MIACSWTPSPSSSPDRQESLRSAADSYFDVENKQQESSQTISNQPT